MANLQITLKANADGIDPRWLTLRSEREDDAVGREILADSLSRRFVTRRGTYITNPAYGLDLDDIIGTSATDDRISRLAQEIEQQAEDDERVDAARATVVSVTGPMSSRRVEMRLDVVPRFGETFSLTLSVKDLSISVLLNQAVA